MDFLDARRASIASIGGVAACQSNIYSLSLLSSENQPTNHFQTIRFAMSYRSVTAVDYECEVRQP